MEAQLLAAVFVDYDNLLPHQKSRGIRDVVMQVLVQLPWTRPVSRGKCEVRIYGGWYEGTQITRLAEDLTVQIQRDFPAIIRVPIENGAPIALSTNASLAVSLLQEPRHHLFNTYRRKGKPRNVRVEKPCDVGCLDVECALPQMKALLKTGRCPKSGCIIANDDLVYRHEQKLVDTMLACDLIYAVDLVSGPIILVSGDDDFLPPLRTALLCGANAVRCYPSPAPQRPQILLDGPHFHEVTL